MKWFKHDSNASTDAKLEKLLIRYGMEGYGLYWYCLELIASQVEKHNLTFELEHDSEVIAHRAGLHIETVQEMMSYMVDTGLFENDRGVVTCLKMAKRTDEYTQKLLKTLQTPDTVPTLSGQNPEKSVLIEENRIEETRKEKKIPENKARPKDASQVEEYAKSIQFIIEGQKFIDHYEANGWMRGKNKIKDWKACVRTWKSNQADSQPAQPQNKYRDLN